MGNVVVNIDTTTRSTVIDITEQVNNIVVSPTIISNEVSVNIEEVVKDIDINIETTVRNVVIDVERNVVPYASPTVSGKMKLYTDLGVNTDGTIDQDTANTNFDLKVDKASGYSLTKNDLTDLLKTAYDNVVTWVSTNGTNVVNHLSNTSNPHSVTKSQVGLSDVPNLTFSGTNTGDQDLTSFVVGGNTEIDFGALPIYEKEFTITDGNVIATSNIIASLAYEAPTGKELDETEIDTLSIICGQSELGSFKMFVKSVDGCYLADKFKINYSITI